MRFRKTFLLLLVVLTFSSFRQDNPAYQLFNKKGKQVKYKKLLKEAEKADIVFFGELHNNPISHWLQLELTQDLFNSKNGMITMGAEMFESDNQIILDEYLQGTKDVSTFEDEARLWKNYKTDIAPLVDFAKENNLRLVATNIPRRYASLVFRGGFEALDTLSYETKAFIAPLPPAYDPELPGYKNMMNMMAGHGGKPNENFPKAQAIKDATMAYFIHKNIEEGKLFIHYHGTYHSDNYEGILWYLNLLRPDLNMLTIATTEAEKNKKLIEEKRGVADFILTVPPNMTKTH
jgi:uncharacterized iron-regulated protein